MPFINEQINKPFDIAYDWTNWRDDTYVKVVGKFLYLFSELQVKYPRIEKYRFLGRGENRRVLRIVKLK